MAKTSQKSVAVLQPIERHIHIIRGMKVMIDSGLAALYEVPTKQFNRAVQRNIERFPQDFMFQLTLKEAEALRCQIGTSKRGGRRYLPYAFTEHGVAMLSAVLHSQRAVRTSILIVRAFVRLREMIAHNKDFAARIEKLENSQRHTGSVIEVLIDEIDGIAREVKQMKIIPEAPKRKIGFDL